uniref:Uncharacterized protein n=1 Tax=Anguilla anguilla TaxID=7936 RepID=A0A0E9PKS4_ANGAN
MHLPQLVTFLTQFYRPDQSLMRNEEVSGGTWRARLKEHSELGALCGLVPCI